MKQDRKQTSAPTKEELISATGKTVPDIIRRGLDVLFCGINPGLYSAAAGHHFARPGNRFWPALNGAGFTPRLLSPSEDRLLVESGYGITNIVDRATATADMLSAGELVAGKTRLLQKLKQYRPRILAVLGVGAYRTAFSHPKATIGLQQEKIGVTYLWVLPNPSGLNANYPLQALVRLFRELKRFAEYHHGQSHVQP